MYILPVEVGLGLLFCIACLHSMVSGRYTPDWPSLDTRPTPSWYDESKFGIFIHWGVFSVPSFGSEWFWYNWQGLRKPEFVQFMKDNYPPSFTYADFANSFNAELFDPDEWADIFQASGAKYVVLTSKHHEGYTLWPSNVSFNWNSMDVGPKKDLVGLLAKAVRKKTSLHFGLYHSMMEWFNPLFLTDKKNKLRTQQFVKTKPLPELYELVEKYEPDIIWSDGDHESWEHELDFTSEYWNSTHFLAWLYNDSPIRDKVVVNDRWGTDAECKHGDFFTCTDSYNPGHLVKHKWENCMTVQKGSWGYDRTSHLTGYRTTKEILDTMIETWSCGGNVLLNIGPTHDGRIMPIFEERLREIGSWLKINGEAVYKSSPWLHQNDSMATGVWYTMRKDLKTVYALFQNWPKNGVLNLGSVSPSSQTTITLLGYEGPEKFTWTKRETGGVNLKFPIIPFYAMPCDWVWTLKFSHIMI